MVGLAPPCIAENLINSLYDLSEISGSAEDAQRGIAFNILAAILAFFVLRTVASQRLEPWLTGMQTFYRICAFLEEE